MLKAKPILEETITRLCRYSSPNCMKVADLGCSICRTKYTLLVTSILLTLLIPHAVAWIVNHPHSNFISMIYLKTILIPSSNHFLISIQDCKKIDKGHKLGSCFMNATPGSFHGRLFPSNSINFFLSANSLHWLSQVK